MPIFLTVALAALLFLLLSAREATPESLTPVQMWDRARAAGWPRTLATVARVLLAAALLALADAFRLTGVSIVAAIVVAEALASQLDILGRHRRSLHPTR